MRLVRQLGYTGALVGALALGGGCTTTTGSMSRGEQTWTMNGSGKTPAAEGKVEVAAKAKDGARQIRVQVDRLARPSAVFEGTTTYVVWVKPEGGRPENVGTLHLDKNLNGDLKTKTPYKVFDVMVTAEMSPATMLPSLNNEVFSTRVYVAT